MASEDRIPPASGRPDFMEHAPEFHLWDYIAVVLKRLPVALAVFTGILLLGVLYTLTRTPTYRAMTRILINPTAIDLTRAEGAVELGAPTGADFIPTQVKLVTSAPVLDRVLERLNLREEAPFADARDPRRMLADRLNVTQVRGTRLLDISATDSDPRRAAAIANMTVTCYMESAREKRIGVSKEGLVQLNNRAEVLRLKMVEASAQVQQFLTTNNITSFASAQRLVEDRMRGINENLWRAEPARMSLKAQVAAADDALRAGRAIDTLPSVMSNTIVSGLLIELAKLGASAAELQFRLGENHPQLKNVDVQREALKTQVGLLSMSILESLRLAHQQSEVEGQLLREAMREQESEIERFNRLATDYEILNQNKIAASEALARIKQRITDIDNSMISGQGDNVTREFEAQPPVDKFSPRHFKNLIMTTALAFFLAVGTCFFLDYMDTSVRSETELQRLFAAPILGNIPPISKSRNSITNLDLIASTDPRHPVAESFRLLRSSLMQAGGGNLPRSLAVTSAMPGDGKSLTAINLALAHAATGRKVLLVDADLRKPRLHTSFALNRTPGLSDLLSGGTALAEFRHCVQTTRFEGLDLLPAGPSPRQPAELLDSAAFRELSRLLCSAYDLVLFDTPPSVQLVDAILTARQTDGALVVVRMMSTPRGAARFLAENLRASGACVIGIAANNADVSLMAGYGSDYERYSSQYADSDDEKP